MNLICFVKGLVVSISPFKIRVFQDRGQGEMLSIELASKIVREVQQVIQEDIIVVNVEGIIMASTEPERIGTFHEGATIVMKTKQKLYIDQSNIAKLKGVRAGISMPIMFGTRAIGVIGVTGDPLKVEPFAELIRRMTELLIKEASYTEQIEWKTKGLEAYFYEWVNLKNVDMDFFERGVLMGIHVQKEHVCCLIQLDMSAVQINEAHLIQRDVIELFHQFLCDDDYIVRWGEGRYLLLKSVNGRFDRKHFLYALQELMQLFSYRYKMKLNVGVGKTVGTSIIRQSYIEAQKALKVAEKKQNVIFYEDLIIDIILEEIPMIAKREYIERTIQALISEEELVHTLQCYIRNNQSIKETSKEMHLHINTLHYRLKQIKELTGIDPKETEGIVQFYFAIIFLNDLQGSKGFELAKW